MTSSLPAAPSLEVYLLGLVHFDDAQAVQRRLVYELGERPGAALILCEHPPTISVGRAGSRVHIKPDDEALRASRVAVRWVNRGGGCVLHMPGQLVGYVAANLPSLGLDLNGYLAALHAMLVDVLAEFELKAHTRDDAPGVYLGPSRVASVGVAVGRWIAYHGFTLNVGAYLDPFRMIDDPAPATSIEAWRQRPAPMATVREAVVRRIEASFRLDRSHVYTAHPLIRRKVRADVFAPSYH